MGGNTSFPCVSRDPEPLDPRSSFIKSPYSDTPDGLSSHHFRLLILKTASLDAFFQSALREKLLFAHIPEFLVQMPTSTDSVLLLSRKKSSIETEKLLVSPFVFLGNRSEYTDSLQHTLSRYRNVQRLETLGGGRDGKGLFLVFRSRFVYAEELVVREMQRNTGALELEGVLNREVRGKLLFKAVIVTNEALFLVLYRSIEAVETGSFLVLEAPDDPEGLLNTIERNEGNIRMNLLGIIPSSVSLLLVYFYE